MSDGLRGFMDALAETQTTPALLFDSEWATSAGRELGKIIVCANMIDEFEGVVPPEVEKFHEMMVDISPTMRQMAKAYADGIDSRNPEKIRTANALKDALNAKAALIIAESDRLKGQ